MQNLCRCRAACCLPINPKAALEPGCGPQKGTSSPHRPFQDGCAPGRCECSAARVTVMYIASSNFRGSACRPQNNGKCLNVRIQLN